MARLILPRRVLIPRGRILQLRRFPALTADSDIMLDLIYIGGGLVVLALYGLYAAALRRV